MKKNLSSYYISDYVRIYLTKEHPSNDFSKIVHFFNGLEKYDDNNFDYYLNSQAAKFVNHLELDNFVKLYDIYFHTNDTLGIEPENKALNIIIKQMNSSLKLKENTAFFTQYPNMNQKKIEHLFLKLCDIRTVSNEITSMSQKDRMAAFEILNPLYEKWIKDDLEKREYFTTDLIKTLISEVFLQKKVSHHNARLQAKNSVMPFAKYLIQDAPDLIFEARKLNVISFLIDLGYEQVLMQEKEKTKERALSFFLANQYKQGEVFLNFSPIDSKGIQLISEKLYAKAKENDNNYVASDSIYHVDNIQKLISFLEKHYIENQHRDLLLNHEAISEQNIKNNTTEVKNKLKI
jgi:hypothetical protein